MRTGTTVTVIRSLMAVLIATLGVVSLLDGRTVVGVILLGLAVTNVTLTLVMHRRRRAWREQLEARRAAFAGRGMVGRNMAGPGAFAGRAGGPWQQRRWPQQPTSGQGQAPQEGTPPAASA